MALIGASMSRLYSAVRDRESGCRRPDAERCMNHPRFSGASMRVAAVVRAA